MIAQKTLTLESLISQMSFLSKQQKEDLYRLLTGLSKEDAQVIFDSEDNIKYAKLNDYMKSIKVELNVVPVEGEL